MGATLRVTWTSQHMDYDIGEIHDRHSGTKMYQSINVPQSHKLLTHSICLELL